jgi:hypothetical protein
MIEWYEMSWVIASAVVILVWGLAMFEWSDRV